MLSKLKQSSVIVTYPVTKHDEYTSCQLKSTYQQLRLTENHTLLK